MTLKEFIDVRLKERGMTWDDLVKTGVLSYTTRWRLQHGDYDGGRRLAGPVSQKLACALACTQGDLVDCMKLNPSVNPRSVDEDKVLPVKDTAPKPDKQLIDTVNHPAHYTAGAVECIDAIKSSMTPEEFRGYLKGCQLKYIWRYRLKGGVEDLKKAGWYLERLIGEVEL